MATETSSTLDSGKSRIDRLALFGAFVALLDTAWGAVISLGAVDTYRTGDIVAGISLLLGFPMYLLDLRLSKRIPMFVLGAFLFRWTALCFVDRNPTLINPFPVGTLLLLAFVLLLSSKLRRKR